MAQFEVVVSDSVFELLDPEEEASGAVDAALEVHQCRTTEELLPQLARTRPT